MARRLSELYAIKVPFDLEELAKQFATLIYCDIPIPGVDGVTINLKVPGKQPTIIVNTSIPATRQRFTLAHELGHIIIPWHTGTIVDEIFTQGTLDRQYSILEEEANNFAAELLMPEAWVESLYSDNKDSLSELHRAVVNAANVSDQAAAIRLIQVLPPEIVFIAVNGDKIKYIGKTEATTAPVPKIGESFDNHFYTLFRAHSTYLSNSAVYHWYDLNAVVELNLDDCRTWSEILARIIRDTVGNDANKKHWMSINGIVSSANATVKSRNDDYSIIAIIIAIKNKLNRKELQYLWCHEDFNLFVHKRAYDFYHGIKKKK